MTKDRDTEEMDPDELRRIVEEASAAGEEEAGEVEEKKPGESTTLRLDDEELRRVMEESRARARRKD